jgi:hypothetical protein
VRKLDLAEDFSPSEGPEGRKSKVEMGYSLAGIASWLVLKRTRVRGAKTCEDLRVARAGLARMSLRGNGFSLGTRLGVPGVINFCC